MARKVTAGHQALRASEHGSHDPGFTHDVVAIAPDGSIAFETECLHAHEVDGATDDYPEGDDAPDGVSHYEVRER